MAKQLNVNLAFTADSAQAKKDIQDLQNQLTKLTNMPLSLKGSDLKNDILQASNAAAELKVHLNNAVNTKTGNLDFTKLNQSIQNSGSSLAEYGAQLQKLGPQGKQAFQALANSVAKAEIPIHRSNAALAGMWTTLKNTARWQISSSVLHGFLGAVQSAYGYAQDLNESLNNIRIVTGQNAEQMAHFAEQANKAARALSTTTTEYTNASLIYYQQGLDDNEVAKRTEVTIKMANAAGQSAQVVSDQLTAVWNNFAKGGENLEYYADVMTALGAATASSTDEISEGLNKFASVAETVGLSYEYAASALATVTATTRQSADVVGTAFKTLFARIQDLELGKTLDDGTTLGTYSQALQKVGVNIKDANGEMKNMDIILAEMAAKWDTLSKDQQVALAQSVAGVRQYTQLIALMDNWDFMEENLSVARNSSGTLDKQAEIYAESWEAAQKRVKAAAEAVYSDLLNDDFFIGLLNGIEKFLGLLDQVLDSIGGVGGALAGISALVLKLFDQKIAQGLTNMVYNMKMLTTAGREAAQNEQRVFVANAAASMNPSMDATIEGATKEASMRSQLEIQAEMIANAEKMSGIEMEVNKSLLDRLRLLGEESAKRAKTVDEAKERTSQASLNVRAQALDTAEMWAGSDAESKRAAVKEANEAVNRASQQTKKNIGNENAINDAVTQIRADGEVTEATLKKLSKAMQFLQKNGSKAFDELLKDMPKVGDSAEVIENKLRKIQSAARDAVDELAEKDFGDAGVFRPSDEGAVDSIQELTDAYREESRVVKEKNEAVSAEQKAMEDLNNRVTNATGAQKTWADTLVGTAQGISSVTMGVTSLIAGFQALANPDLSGWEKFTSILMSFGTALPMVMSGLSTLKTQFSGMNQTMVESIGIKTAMIGLYGAENTALITSIALDKTATEAEKIKQLQEKLGMTQEQAANALKQGTIIGKTKNIAMTIAEAIANKAGAVAHKAKTAAEAGETAGIWAKVAAKIAELAVSWPLLAVTLLIVAALVALAAIVFVIVSAFQSLSAAYNKDAIAAENAENAARGLAEAYNEAKQSYEDMIAAMDNYQSARESLDSLTEGTVEYLEALNKANEAALQLIEMGDLVKGQDYTIENGEIIITDEAMKSAKQKEFDKMMEAQASSTMANAKAAQAKAKANQTELVRSDNLNVGGAAGIGALLYGPFGALVGALGTQFANDIGDSIQRSQIDELTALYDQIGEAAFDSATLQELGFDTANQAYIDSVKEVVRETNLAAEQMEVAAELAASAVLEKNEAYQNSDHKDKIAGAAGKGYQAEYEKAYEEAMQQTKNNDWFGIGSNANKAAMEEYAKQMGLKDLNGYKVTNFKKGGNVEYEYIDESGQKQTVEITQQQIAAQLASTKASEELAKQTQTLLDTFNRLEDSANKADQALADFASGELANASKSEFEDMESELEGSITTDEKGNRVLSDQGALDYINANFSAEELEAMGYASAEEAAAAFKKQFDANLKAWGSIELPDNLIGTGDMSLKTAQNFENIIENLNLGPAAGESGEKAGANFVEGINKMLEGLSAEDQAKALEKLATIDWSDWDALEQADAIMKEFGVDIDTTSSEWQKFTKEMRIAAGATPDFSKLRDTLTSITAILQDLDFGSVISDEDYQRLVQYNDEWERYFMLQANGSRVFIGDSQAMQQEVRNNVIEQRKALQERKAAQEGFEKANWGHNDDNNNWIKADWGNKSGSDTGTATNLMKASGATEEALKELGYTDEVIQDMITKATSGQKDLVAEGEAALREMYQRIDAFTEEELTEMDAQFDEMMASTAANVNELQSLLASDQISEEAYDKQLSALANKAKTLEELQQIQSSGLNGKVGLDTYEYGQALSNLASNYENCADEAEEYSKALLTGDEATIEAAQSALEAAVEIGELAEKYDLNGEQLEDYAKRLKTLHKDSNLSTKDAAKLAAANMRLDRGIGNLNDNLDDYKKALKESNRGSAEWSQTLSDLKTDLADILNIADGSMLSDAFAEATLNSEDLKRALDGDGEAILRLRMAAADDIIANLEVDDSALASVNAQWEYLKANLANDIAAGGINDEQMVAAFNKMIEDGNMTKEQIEAALAGLNVSANVHTEYVQQKVKVPTSITEEYATVSGYVPYDYPKPDGSIMRVNAPLYKRYSRSYEGEPAEVEGYVPKYTIEGTNDGSGSITSSFTSLPTPTVSKSQTTSGKNSGGGGGGGGSPSAPKAAEKREPTKKSDVAERYREVTDAIDNVTDALTRAERATDRLWGKDKLAAMRKENKILEEQRDLILAKAKEAEKYAKEDAANLRKVAKDIGVSVVIDQNTGDITNIEDVEETLYNRLAAAEAEYNARVEAYNQYLASIGDSPTEAQVDQAETMQDALDAYEEDILGKIEKDIETWEDAEQQFQESVETWEEAGLEAEEILDQIMQNNYDIIMEGLEIPLSLNEEDLRLVDLKLSQIEDDMYSMAEAVALTTGKLSEYQENLGLVNETLAELNRAHAAGEITDAAYQEGLNEIKDKYYDNIEALMELDKTMQEYYSNTIDLANEELSKYTDQMEHQTSVLEHYNSLIELMGKSKDYKMIGKVLEGQVKTTRDAMNVSKQWYDTLRTNADALATEYSAAVARGASDAELEIIKKNWDAAEAAANEAQDKMLSDAEAWAEALKAVLENDLAEFGQTLENALTGGTSFDTLTTQMERAVSLQEDYLTTTNKIYETNKLINTAQQAIDKTTNSAAKRRLKAYINETEQLQNQSKLSRYELEIQQMKYDLLLAEIALQEAQDSKSTVRLQRDAEGNFGYVYTADQDKVAEAEQKLADAQNALYNKGLEGANEYTEKYQQTIQEMYDTLTEIQEKHLNNEYETEEEYHKAMTDAKAYYYQKLQDYSSLYSVAVSTDSRVVADAWSTDFTNMMYDTDQWKHAIEKYTDQAIAAFTKWQTAVTGEGGITTLIGNSVDEVGKTVQTVTDKSAELAKTTREEVIPALDTELDSVNNLTGAYAKMRDTIKETIQYYTDMINRINNSQTNEWNSGNSDDDNTNGGNDGNNGNTGNGSNAGNDGNNNGENGNNGNNNGGNGNGGAGSSYKEGTLEFTGDGASRVWTDSSGTRYAYGSEEQKAIQKAFDKAYAVNGGYTGDYWIGWTSSGGKLNADILHKKYGLSTGGYTGNWDGSYGKLAFLHQKELVLNAEDTENFLASMEVMERILKIIDLQSASAQLGGLLSSPGFNNNGSQVIEQNVHIEASFPAVQDRNEIEEAFNTLINKASQYANRK